MIPEPQMPTYEDLLWPTLKALESIGGSASIQELSSQLAIDMSLPDEILDVLHKDGPQTKVFYRAALDRVSGFGGPRKLDHLRAPPGGEDRRGIGRQTWCRADALRDPLNAIQQPVRHASEWAVGHAATKGICLGVALILIRHAARLQGNATTLSGTMTS